MNRVVVKDGTIAARLRFRAAAADHAKVDYAISDDPTSGGSEWGRRGSRTFSAPTTKVSTVGVNVQTDSELKAELFGDVKINFCQRNSTAGPVRRRGKKNLARASRPAAVGRAGAFRRNTSTRHDASGSWRVGSRRACTRRATDNRRNKMSTRRLLGDTWLRSPMARLIR